jgi:hypothetical protein
MINWEILVSNIDISFHEEAPVLKLSSIVWLSTATGRTVRGDVPVF